MKRTIYLLVAITCLLMSLPGLAQRVSISQKNAPLRTIFTSIKEQTGISVIYETSLLRNATRVTLQINDLPLQDALKLIFEHQPIRYEYTSGSKVILLFPAPLTATQAPPQPTASTGKINIKGRVTTLAGEPVASATVIAPASSLQVTTDEHGDFSMNNVISNEKLIISLVSYETEVIEVNGRKEVNVTLYPLAKELSEVVVSTGFQKQSIEKLTGSFFKVNNELLNRRVSTTVLDRLDGVTSSLLFNKNLPNSIQNPSNISIRGRSTIYANPEPLIILDNFPYTGNPTNINPNDVESITVLKDAAAASIWGAYAANGVIVITTKTGKYNQPIRLSFNSNITIGKRPDLYYEPNLNSSEYIDVERFLFNHTFYLNQENDIRRLALSPAVEIMIQERDGEISSGQATILLDKLRSQDVRKDLEKYFYRHSVNQQYSINASGGGPHNQYYFSTGYDKNLTNLVGDQYDRVTLNANNTFTWLNRKLELTSGIIFSATQSRQANTFLPSFPYADLADDNGQPLSVNYGIRQPYKDTAGGGRLLSWDYKPLDELHLADNKTTLTDYRINVGLKYSFLNDLSANILYQYNRGFAEQRNLQNVETYFTRDLINQFTQLNGVSATMPIPYGSILDRENQTYQAHNLRGQANYIHNWSTQHIINAFAGAEIRNFTNQFTSTRLYGYDPARQTSIPVDYKTMYPIYNNLSALKTIPNLDRNRLTTDRYISYFINAAYTIHQRYTISASARKDESNIFGVKTNRKGVPLWSTGISWEISKENFYRSQSNWLPYLRLRITHGYNGNVDRSVSAFTTAQISGINSFNALPGRITNPPNPALRWEKVQMTNIGVDFTSLNNIVSGSLEYYQRHAKDLIGYSPLDPTTGVAIFRGNTADIKGKGIDITIHTQNVYKKTFKWMSALLFSYTKDEVTAYKARQNAIGAYLNPDQFNPLQEKPLYAVYSLRWMGLDPLTGDPQGLLNNEVSKDYSAILNSTNFNELQYNGSANPTLFGSIRNTMEWNQFQLSFNVTFKAGYYFRRPSINYNDLFNGSKDHPDFSNRWQKPGDETQTYIPSMEYPNTEGRDNFYKFSSVLVEKGDHIRLQDIRLSYDCSKQMLKKLPIQGLQLYVYANNIGLIWKANKQHIDPDYISSIPAPRTMAGGIKIDFR